MILPKCRWAVIPAVAMALASCGGGHGQGAGSSGAGSSTSALPASGSRSTSSTPPADLASAYLQCNSATSAAGSPSDYPNGITPQWLSSQESAWASAAPSPFILSPTLNGASYDNWATTRGNDLQVVQEELAMEEQTGGQAVTIDLGYDPWLSGDTATIANDTTIIDAIRSSGHLVVIKDASAERYRHYPLPWSQFAAAWVQRVKTIAALYHPDYYTVIKEPPWYAPMIAGLSRTNISSTVDQQVTNVGTWTSLLSQLISAVHSVSPQTKVGVATDANLYRGQIGDKIDLGLMTAAASMPGVDFLGFDIYTAHAFCDTLKFLSSVNTTGKGLWINEAWSTTAARSSNPAQEQLDPTWAKVLLDFASYIHAQGVSPFFTNYFASYSQPPTTTSGLLSFYRGRTPVFQAFQSYEKQCHSGLPASAKVSTPC